MDSIPDNIKPTVELLSELVACASVNPGETDRHEPPYGETRLAQRLGERLAGWGARVELPEIAPGRGSVVATFAGADPSRTLLLEAHADTVEAADMGEAAFRPVVRDGRLYGRGACDTKGPMAAMLLAIRAVLDAEGQLPATVVFAATCDEEAHSLGLRGLLEGGFAPTLAVVGEPTDLKVVCVHKGVARFRIRTLGRSGHSSQPAAGVNAISHMAQVVRVLDEVVAPALAGRSHRMLSGPTLSVGIIEGGTQVNIIPAECTLQLDRRLLPGETVESAQREIVAALDTLGPTLREFRYTIEPLTYFPPFDEGPDGLAARLVGEACQAVLGASECVGAPWAANTGFLGEAGIPCVTFGPGSIAQAHTGDEFIDLEQLAQGQAVYERIIRDFAGLRLP